MKNLPNSKLLYIGLFFNSAVLIFTHFYNLPDFITGILMGIGLGLMLTPFILQKKKNLRH